MKERNSPMPEAAIVELSFLIQCKLTFSLFPPLKKNLVPLRIIGLKFPFSSYKLGILGTDVYPS